jgi:heme/copper-type cytochrome/quinol oxidase subunit 1
MNIAFAVACSTSFIVTIFYLSRAGVRWIKMRPIVLTTFFMSVLVFISFLLLEIAACMQIADSIFGLDFLPPAAVPMSREPVPDLRKHLFWFLGHPEVYILLLLLVGSLAESIRMLVRKIAPA